MRPPNHRRVPRAQPTRVAALLVGLLLAAACGPDDQIATPSNTTVPVSDATTPTSTNATEVPETTGAPETPTDPETEEPTLDLNAVDASLASLGTFAEPVDTVAAANGELWLLERAGRILALDSATGAVEATVLDISDETVAQGERGLLGAAVNETHLFINYTDLDGNTHVDAVTLDDNGRPGQRRNLLQIEQPFPNHNGGGLTIGPDGHLYIGVGDGGAANDPLLAGQDPDQLLGSILRIAPTPDAADPYAIPADNPYADGVEGRPEIFMIGARNPWRISFDPITDDFWIADVGQNEWEEVNVLRGVDGWGLGGNLGWNLREGTHEFTGEGPDGGTDPVFEYPHGDREPSGCSVSGGQIYRGTEIPALTGAYVFGDFCRSSIWAIAIVDGIVEFRDLEIPFSQLVGITADAGGELLALSLDGDLSRIVSR